jgi:hypothetical protein
MVGAFKFNTTAASTFKINPLPAPASAGPAYNMKFSFNAPAGSSATFQKSPPSLTFNSAL